MYSNPANAVGFEAGKHYLEISGGQFSGFSGSFTDRIKKDNSYKMPFIPDYTNFSAAQRSAQESLFLYHAIENESQFNGGSGRIQWEYGLFKYLGFGFYMEKADMKFKDYHFYNPENLWQLYNYQSQYATVTGYNSFFQYYSNSFAAYDTILSGTRNLSIIMAGFSLSFHPFPGSAIDPYIKLAAGGGREVKYNLPVIHGGGSIGIRYYFSENAYIFTEAERNAWYISSPNRGNWNMSSEIAPNRGQLLATSVSIGIGVNLDILESTGTGTLVSESRPSAPAVAVPEISKEMEERNILLEGLKKLNYQVSVDSLKLDDAVRLRLPNDLFFKAGSAELSSQGKEILVNIGKLLAKTGNEIRIEGHTDNTPLGTRKFKSNWELASARAISVIRIFAKAGVAKERVSAVSYGDTRPLFANVTKNGRSANRRVEILILFKKEKETVVTGNE